MSTSSFAQEQAGVRFDLAGITNTVGCLIAIWSYWRTKGEYATLCLWFFESAQLR
jgi:hypothetical protein